MGKVAHHVDDVERKQRRHCIRTAIRAEKAVCQNGILGRPAAGCREVVDSGHPGQLWLGCQAVAVPLRQPFLFSFAAHLPDAEPVA